MGQQARNNLDLGVKGGARGTQGAKVVTSDQRLKVSWLLQDSDFKASQSAIPYILKEPYQAAVENGA